MNTNTRNPIKQALDNRAPDALPPGFNARMMERIRQKAESRRRRNCLINWISLISASLSLVAFGVYVLFVRLHFSLDDLTPNITLSQPSGELTSFYWYIAIPVLILLGLDYWLRLYSRKHAH